MSLIAMAVHDTEENGREKLTSKTLSFLFDSMRPGKNRVFVIDNGSCNNAKGMLYYYRSKYDFNLITLPENIGTAAAINLAWKQRQPGEHCIKIDDDVIINNYEWVEEMEEVIRRDRNIGQVGLKRKDCWEHPAHENSEWRSQLYMLPHQPYQKWVVVEKVKHVIGTCVMHNAALLDKVGYLWQPGLYGYDDVLMSWRSKLAGFYNCFLPHIDIDHIDPGGDEYSDWKTKHSGQYSKIVSDIVDEYISGKRSLFYD